MKVTYFEEVENHTALDSKKFCYNCGSHIYNIHHQLMPEVENSWWVECDECHAEGPASPSKEIAIARWKQL